MDDYFLIERHLVPMLEIARSLGDELVNAAPDLPGANTPYQLVWHCCGMLEWWTREAILGEDVGRDRDAEFVAQGTVDQLGERVAQVAAQLAEDLRRIDPDDPPRGDPSPQYVGTPIGTTAAGALLHVLEELAQHHGHLEITRDLLLR